MKKSDMRRRNPIAHLTLVLVGILIVFEALVIFGAFELQAQTVAKYAPWAYEPFLRLVGEHPDSLPRWATVEDEDETPKTDSSVAGVTGLDATAIPMLMETNAVVLGTNRVLEATVPLEVEPESVPVVAPTNSPPLDPAEVVPVG